MRHNKKFNHLGRKKGHRDAMLANMSVSLIMHKRIFTTLAKAKALRKIVEPIITKAVNAKDAEDATHNRRQTFQSLRDKEAVKELFENVVDTIGDRPGGYTRIIRTGNRLGDNAEMCFIELVDYNENMLKEAAKKTTRRSRTRRAGKKTTDASVVDETVEATEKPATKTAEKPVKEAAKKPAAKKATAKKDATEEKAKAEKKAAPKKEEKKESPKKDDKE